MEVHAHSHTPRKKWTHYFWEFLMLFLAVFCGFLAENQREHFIEGKKEKQYLKSLWLDLQRDTSSLSDISSRFTESNKMIDTLFQLLKNSNRNEFTCKIYRLAMTIPFADILPQPDNKTFEQLKSSGNLRLIHDNELLDRIGAYYKRYDFMITGGPGQMLFHNRHDLYLFTYELFDVTVFHKLLQAPESTAANGPSNPDPCIEKPVLLSNDPIVINKICARYYYIQMTRKILLNWIEGFLEQADSLLERLQKEYHFKN